MMKRRTRRPGPWTRRHPSPPLDEVYLTTLASLDDARRHARELAELAIRATIARVRNGWALLVPWYDLDLAAAICDIPIPSRDAADAPRQAAVRPLRGAIGRGLLAVPPALAVGGLGVFLLAPSPLGGWTDANTASATVFDTDRVHASDDDGNGVTDRMVIRGSNGVPTAVWVDRDQDGVVDQFLRIYPETQTIAELRDDDGDGLPEANAGWGTTAAGPWGRTDTCPGHHDGHAMTEWAPAGLASSSGGHR